MIWAFGLLSLVLLTGYVGQISLCQATFAGVGAYTAGLMVAGFHADYLVAVVAGVAAAFVLGVIVGIPALRLRGITLAIVTLGIALVFDRYVFQDHAFEWFTGGTAGWRVDQATMFGLQMDSSKHLMAAYIVLLALFIGSIFSWSVSPVEPGCGRVEPYFLPLSASRRLKMGRKMSVS